jgi:hypothetical protein
MHKMRKNSTTTRNTKKDKPKKRKAYDKRRNVKSKLKDIDPSNVDGENWEQFMNDKGNTNA